MSLDAAAGPIGAMLATLRSLYKDREMRRLTDLLTRLTDAYGITLADHVGTAEERRTVRRNDRHRATRR